MTTNKKQLPKSLAFDFIREPDVSLMRRRMSKLCSDNQARLFRHTMDKDQPLLHTGVLLKGREIFGWLIRMASGRNYKRKPGMPSYTLMEFLLLSPAYHAHVAAMDMPYLVGRADSFSYNALRTIFVSHDEEGGEVEEKLWNEDLCADITRALGMVEIFDASARLQGFESRGVLVPAPEGDDGWQVRGRKMVEAEALDEVRPARAWWDLPSGNRTVYIDAPEIAPPSHDGAVPVTVRFLNTVPHVLLERGAREHDFVFPRAYKFSATVKIGSQLVDVEAKRSLAAALNWSISIKSAAGSVAPIIYEFHSLANVVDGRKAIDIALEACRHGGKLPKAVEIGETSDEMALSLDSWRKHIASTQEAHRRLKFVLDAMAEVPQ